MKLSLELSLYPLDDNFLAIIKDIVERLNADTAVACRTNCMSTQVFGDYVDVMRLLDEILRYSFETYGRQVFVAKFIKGDLNQRDTLDV